MKTTLVSAPSLAPRPAGVDVPHRHSRTYTRSSVDLTRRIPAQRGRPITVIVRPHRKPTLDATSRAVIVGALLFAAMLIAVLAVAA